MKSILSLGEALIDFVPEENGKALKDVHSFVKAPGGAPANVAAAVAKLGGNVSFIGKVGNDGFGKFLIETLDQAGVKTDKVFTTNDALTSLAFVSLKEDGERDFSFYRDPAADQLLNSEELQNAWFEGEGLFHFGSVSQTMEPCKSATSRAVELALAGGMIVSYDPNVRLQLWSSAAEAKETILNTIPYAHLIKISEEECFFLTGEQDENKAVRQLIAGNVKALLITKGEKGSTLHTKSSSIHVPSIQVKPVDTTGAGDAFVGGLLFGLSQQNQTFETIIDNEEIIKEILVFANACGALTTMKRGAILALPSQEEVKELILKKKVG
ncbi:PfkB family carbohydrate kinase [Litchfieldia salsa]|uniref:Fructokinase n=1 Tax=Litchfieldia salsa TaxID=930152 RepID=A0A1H0WRK9_9BACI|nr:PfkB family carbohydrate kinase [Litchfieldia salsa]SDP93283.1 fructokinase [Litchfieldia salsa]